MEYDPYVVLPEEVASSIIFYKEENDGFEEHLLRVGACGLVSKVWCFCVAKYCLINARNEFTAGNYVASRKYLALSSSLNPDPSSPASFYCDVRF